MLAETKVGPRVAQDGAVLELRADKTGSLVVTDGHARYAEATLRGGMFSMVLVATTTGVAAGNIVAAAAAASTAAISTGVAPISKLASFSSARTSAE